MQGRCFVCGKMLSKAGMANHLKNHLEGERDGETELFHIGVDGLYNPEYWLHIEIPANAGLRDLDQFLRDVWLECCGHLSAFRVEGVTYYSEPSAGERGMNVQLAEIMSVGSEFYHIYDFGSSTELGLRVVSKRKGKIGREKVRVLARNNPPDVRCKCGKKARWVCTLCLEEDSNAWLCDDCSKEHKCGEEMFLPVVNSPRVGVCGYEGGEQE